MPGTGGRPPALYWVGFGLMVLGATLAGNFVFKHVRESDPGHSYVGFIAGSVLVALVGFGVMVVALRPARSQASKPGDAPEGGDW